MSDPALRTLTEEYLRTEEESPMRREYVDGFVYAQAGATNAHNLITSNIHVSLYRSARDSSYRVYQSDMKVHVQRIDTKRFYYPDLVVSCEKLSNKATALEEPCLIVEILNAGTRQVDMTYKVKDYLGLPSLQGYLMVDSENRAAKLYRRLPNGWTQETVQSRVKLPYVNLELSLDEIYVGENL